MFKNFQEMVSKDLWGNFRNISISKDSSGLMGASTLLFNSENSWSRVLTHSPALHRDRLALIQSHYYFFIINFRWTWGQSLWFGCFYLSECGTQHTAPKRVKALTEALHQETRNKRNIWNVTWKAREPHKRQRTKQVLNQCPWKQHAIRNPFKSQKL